MMQHCVDENGADCGDTHLKQEMAEKNFETGQDGCGNCADSDLQNKADTVMQTSKRSENTDTAAPQQCLRTDIPSPTTHTPEAELGPKEMDEQEMQTDNTEDPPNVALKARRKSWRRATLTRRSLPGLSNPYQFLCRSISTSLPQEERLEKLMEAAMTMAMDRTKDSLQAVSGASLETFQKQVEYIKKEWRHLAESIRSESKGKELHPSRVSYSDPATQRAMEKIKKAINRLETESESWESLLNKHRSKAEELERKVEQGQERGISLATTSLAGSSQYAFTQSKPDYHSLLRRQQPVLQTMEMIMDSQCKMVRRLLSIKEQSQLVVKETSGRLAADSGFQDLSPDLVRNLIAPPSSSAAK